MLNRKTTMEVEKINKYEKKWKIQTNVTKFTTLPITHQSTIDDKLVEFKSKGNPLGITCGIFGYSRNAKEKTDEAMSVLTKRQRSKHLSQRIDTPDKSYGPIRP